MCSSSSSGWTRVYISDDREDADTTTHEMGHNNHGPDHESQRPRPVVWKSVRQPVQVRSPVM
jgi:hypothetical protein